MTTKDNNYCVIMAGGIGSRFWPFSTEKKPKQFLDFFGTGRSLLQMTVDRFRPIVPIENMIVVTNKAYKEIILEQVPDMKESQILCEPARRNTAPCIAYATAHIRAICRRHLTPTLSQGEGASTPTQPSPQGRETGFNPEARETNTDPLGIDWTKPEMQANIVVAASDHLILEEEKFRETISKAFDFVEENKAIVTLGMEPTRPETGYGYIHVQRDNVQCTKDDEDVQRDEVQCTKDDVQCTMYKGTKYNVQRDKGIYPVKEFKEKPDLVRAKEYVASGDYLWNSGIFVWSLETINEAIENHMPELAEIFAAGKDIIGTEKEEAWIAENFPKCPNISVDYGIMEKAENVYVLPSSFGWSDLGTWGSLYELSEKDKAGNVSLHSEAKFVESEGNIVVLEKGKKAIVQGVSGLIIAEQDGALLVCRKSEEQRIKEWVSKL